MVDESVFERDGVLAALDPGKSEEKGEQKDGLRACRSKRGLKETINSSYVSSSSSLKLERIASSVDFLIVALVLAVFSIEGLRYNRGGQERPSR
jgi:hypothetical protein